jgi:hypothetical protein
MGVIIPSVVMLNVVAPFKAIILNAPFNSGFSINQETLTEGEGSVRLTSSIREVVL